MLEQPLGRRAAQLESPGQGEDVVHQLRVEERRTGFEARRHRSAVHLHVEIIQEVRRGIDVEDLVQRVGRPRAVEDRRVAPPQRLVASERRERGLQQLTQVCRREVARPTAQSRREIARQLFTEAPRPRLDALVVAAVGHKAQRRRRETAHRVRHVLGEVRSGEARVPREQLVAAVTGERHRHLLPRQARHDEGGDGRRVAERFVVVPRQLLDEIEALRLHAKLGVLGLVPLRHLRRPGGLVPLGWPLEADGEGLDGLAGDLRHGAHDERAVDAARQERAQRHVRDETLLHRRKEELTYPCRRGVERRGVAHRLLGANGEVPVATHLVRSTKRVQFPRGGLDLADAPVERAWRRHIPMREKLGDRSGVDGPVEPRVREDRLDLRAQHQPRIVFVDEQRLLAGAVAGQQQRAVARVPQREREHAVEARDSGGAPRLPRRDDDLGVALRAKREALGDQLLAQFLEVVDLTVEAERHATVGAEHRLVGVG